MVNYFRLKQERYRLDVKRKFFTQREVRPWRSCPGKLSAPSLEALKAGLDGALGSLSCWVALPRAGGWKWVVSSLPTQVII